MGVVNFTKLVYGFELERKNIERIRPRLVAKAATGELGEPDELDEDFDPEDAECFGDLEVEEWDHPLDFTDWVMGVTAMTAVSPEGYRDDGEDLVYFGIELAGIDPWESGESAMDFDIAKLPKMTKWLQKLARELKIKPKPKLWLLMCSE